MDGAALSRSKVQILSKRGSHIPQQAPYRYFPGCNSLPPAVRKTADQGEGVIHRFSKGRMPISPLEESDLMSSGDAAAAVLGQIVRFPGGEDGI